MIKSAMELISRCGATVRLFNYPPEDGPATHLQIVTNSRMRVSTRRKASLVFQEQLKTYLKSVDVPSKTCAELRVDKVTLTTSDPRIS